MSLLTTLLESSGASTNGLLDFRGSYDASVNTFPATGGSGNSGAIIKGDFWLISVGGTLGGSAVSVGDTIYAIADTPGQTAGNWAALEGNIGYTPENSANKDTDGTLSANSDTKYPSQKAVKTALDLKAPIDSPSFTGTVNMAGLTASQVVVTDASKNLASLAYGTTATASTLVQRDANGTIVPKTPNDQTGTTYTFVITDAERTVTANNASASTYTIPLAASVAYPVGTQIKLINKGVGAVETIKSGSDTLIGNPTTNQNATSYLEKIAESAGVSTWHIFAGTATVTEVINGSAVGTIVNQAYDISVRMPYGGTITSITTKSTTTAVAGTFTVAISGTNVTGLTTVANGASGVRTNTAPTAANTFVAGDYITITLAGATITDLFWSLAYTRVY